jgi:hypothetical protein
VIATATRRRGKRAVNVEVHRTLCALVRCGGIVVAIPADMVIFIALLEDVTVARRDGAVAVSAGELVAPAWELGPLLDVDAPSSAWLFLNVAVDHGTATVALGCSQCLEVTRLADPVPLPRGVFRADGDAIIGAFEVDTALIETGCGVAGIWIDPKRLIGADAITRATRGAT